MKKRSTTQFARWGRADIPRTFPDAVKDLIMVAMDNGGEARLSNKGHAIIRNDKKQTTAVGRNFEARAFKNAKADIARLFPGSGKRVEAVPDTLDKMCKKCKHRKPLDDFYYDKKKDYLFATCKECTKAANKAWREAHRDPRPEPTAEAVKEPAPTFERPITPAPEIWKPTDTLTRLATVINADAAKEITRLRQENHELRAALEAIHRDTEKWG